MKKIFTLALGVVTSIGGFVEVGSISTAAQAGAEFGFTLLWTIPLATLILALLAEMAGRVAVISKRSMAAAVRERFGFHFQLIPLTAEFVIDVLLLSAEIGGAAVAVKLLTNVGFQWWILPVGIVVWMVLWLGNFSIVEDGVGLLGIITLSFVVAVWRLHPAAETVASGLVPRLPTHDPIRFAFIAISIVGATVSPYLLNFYSSGAIEEDWGEADLWINRITSYVGMGFGSVVSMGVLITAALVLAPQHIKVDSYEQASLMFVPVFHSWAVPLFALSLGVGCFGAAVEITLNAGYVAAQTFGWSWGINRKRKDVARFTAAFTVVLLLSLALALTGLDPLQVTLLSVALTVVIMPVVVLPFLVLMNDEQYVKKHKTSSIGNGILAALTILGALMALVVIPLEIFGS